MEGHQKGVTKTKDFRYPPILPIVYYEDKAEWTSPMRLRDRVFMSDVLGDYVPDYRYLLFRLQEHGDAELIAKRDEISLIMLINELKSIFAREQSISYHSGSIIGSGRMSKLRILQP